MLRPKTTFGALHFQDRDFMFLRGLFESRVMTTAHIAALCFGGKKEAAKKRLQKIKAAGLVSERKRRVNEPSILFLTRKGFSVLSEQDLLSEYPKLSPVAFEKRANVSELTIRHELEVMDVKAAFYLALKDSLKFSIVEFNTWPRLNEFQAMRPNHGTEVLVKPDGFIRVHEKEEDGGVSEHTFFLEVDRSSETQGTLVSRAACYLDYYKSGGFAVANGATRSNYKDYPFRVLIILKNVERRNNTADRLLESNPPILTLTYLSTLKDTLSDPIGPVWIRPRDYRNAISNTAFEKRAAKNTYRREAQREKEIEEKINKIGLFRDNTND